jgi:multidrug efflux pump subunit AcrB
MAALREEAEKVKSILRNTPFAQRVRDDWGEDIFTVKLQTDSDRANLAGITNLGRGRFLGDGNQRQSVDRAARRRQADSYCGALRMEERAQLADVQNLYVYSMQGDQKVPLRQVSSLEYGMQTEKVRRRNQFRTITVSVHGRTRSPAVRDNQCSPTTVDSFCRSASAGLSHGLRRVGRRTGQGFQKSNRSC